MQNLSKCLGYSLLSNNIFTEIRGTHAAHGEDALVRCEIRRAHAGGGERPGIGLKHLIQQHAFLLDSTNALLFPRKGQG